MAERTHVAPQMGPVILKGPNGTIEMKCANAVQGWHSQYFAPDEAREAAKRLVSLADQLDEACDG